MGIIQKRADELKPGDVLPVKDGRVVVINVRGLAGEYTEITACVAGEPYSELMPRIQREHANTRIAVESPDLTPAQLHAEELVSSLKVAREAFLNYPNFSASQFTSARNLAVEKASALLDKIKPPEPPTLAEMADVIESLVSPASRATAQPGSTSWRAFDVLDRARRAKVLP